VQLQRPCIYVIATPIGNLGDLGDRARRVLAGVDMILAEDTRVARKLMNSFGIDAKQVISFHDHVEKKKTPELIRKIQEQNLAVALISDAGTPCIADPGYSIIAAAHQSQIQVSPIPGASAVLALASSAGLPTDRLLFVGFLPEKEKARLEEVQSWASLRATVVFFEALRRAAKTLATIAQVYPNARIAVGRELTKLYEEIHQFDAAGAVEWIESLPVQKGELVVAVHIAKDIAIAEQQSSLSLIDEIRVKARQGFEQGMSLKDLLKLYSKSSVSRSDLYQLLLEVKEEVSSQD
jgi:16S rRNA (cytidine1402-2'-O)-methyltransferase